MKSSGFGKLVAFLTKLEQRSISYSLAHHRDEAMMVTVAIPGERWEIEFFADESVEIERFRSNGDIHGEEALADLFQSYADLEHPLPSVQTSERTTIS
jgi:hypothetical protein